MSEENTTKHSRSVMDLTWQDAEELKRYTTELGKIFPRKKTKLSAKAQRHVTRMIKRARNMLLLK